MTNHMKQASSETLGSKRRNERLKQGGTTGTINAEGGAQAQPRRRRSPGTINAEGETTGAINAEGETIGTTNAEREAQTMRTERLRAQRVIICSKDY